MTIDTVINIDYLIPTLRLHLGDTDPAAYRYIDGWLRVALVTGVKSLQRWWGARYLVDATTFDVTRSDAFSFTYEIGRAHV